MKVRSRSNRQPGPLNGNRKYHRIAQILESDIRNRYKPGQRYESEISLSRRLEVNRETIHRAVLLLEQEGLLTTKGQRGAVVADFHEQALDREALGVVMAIRNHMTDQLFLSLSTQTIERRRFPVICDVTGINTQNPFGERLPLDSIRDRLKAVLRFRPRTIVTDMSARELAVLQEIGNGSKPFRNVVLTREVRVPGFEHCASILPDIASAWNLQGYCACQSGYTRLALFIPHLTPGTRSLQDQLAQKGNGGYPEAAQRIVLERDPQWPAKLADLARADGGPLAVLCSYDFGAHLAQDALRKAGIAIPDQVGIYGINNTPWAIQEDLTSIAFDPDVWAREIFDVEEQLESDGRAVDRLIPPTLVQRGSTHGIGFL